MPDDFQPLSQVGQQQDDFQPLGGPGAGDTSKTASAPQKEKSAFEQMQALRYPQGKPQGGLLDKLGGPSGLGATGASIIATMLAPETGGMSILIPALAAAGGGTAGKLLEGAKAEEALGTGFKEFLTQGAFGTALKTAPMIPQAAKDMLVKMFGGRSGTAEAAASLFKRWFSGPEPAASLWKKAAQNQTSIPVNETVQKIDEILKGEEYNFPTELKSEILEPLTEMLKHAKAPAPAFPASLIAQKQAATAPIVEKIEMGKIRGIRGGTSAREPLKPAEVPPAPASPLAGKEFPAASLAKDTRRFNELATRAYENGNNDLGKAYSDIRNALMNDLEKNGVPEVRAAAKASRREIALKNLSSQIAKPFPGMKLAEYAKKDKLFEGAFEPHEKAQIDRIVRKLEYVIPSAGSGLAGRAITALGGAGIGHMLGLPGDTVGAIGGYLTAEHIRNLLASPAGRDFMEKTLEGTYKMAPNRIALIAPTLAIFARGLTASQPQQEEQY